MYPILSFLLTLILCAAPGNLFARERSVLLSLPAETIQTSLQKILPLEIPSQYSAVRGQITLESIQDLSVQEQSIRLRGVLSGKNVAVRAKIGEHPFNVQLTQLRLPLHCELMLRLDAVRGQLFVKPRFIEQGSNISDAGLGSLLTALGAREYPVDLSSIERFRFQVGKRSIAMRMQPVNIIGQDNSLVVHLQPRLP